MLKSLMLWSSWSWSSSEAEVVCPFSCSARGNRDREGTKTETSGIRAVPNGLKNLHNESHTARPRSCWMEARS